MALALLTGSRQSRSRAVVQQLVPRGSAEAAVPSLRDRWSLMLSSFAGLMGEETRLCEDAHSCGTCGSAGPGRWAGWAELPRSARQAHTSGRLPSVLHTSRSLGRTWRRENSHREMARNSGWLTR